MNPLAADPWSPLAAAFGGPVWWAENFAMIAPWYLYAALLGWVAWPLVRRALPALRDEGWSQARLAALVATAFVDWLARVLVGGGAHAFGALAGWPAVAILAGVGLAAWWRDRRELGAALRRLARPIVAGEVFLLLLWLFLAGVRSYTPGITFDVADNAGEKFTDFALLNAAWHAPALPPEHPWMAGEPLNYYYFGYSMWALPGRLLGTPPAVAYNQAFCLAFALLGAQLAGLLFHLGGGGGGGRGWGRLAWAGGGASAILFGGNLLVWNNYLQSSSATTDFLHNFNYWTGSRAIAEDITEFPAFTFLHGDLHPHVTGVLLLLAFAAWLAQWPAPARLPRFDSFAHLLGRDQPPALPAYVRHPAATWLWPAFFAGAMYATNAWDLLPAAALTAAVAVALAAGRRLRPLDASLLVVATAAAMLAGIRLIFAGFSRQFVAPTIAAPPPEGAGLVAKLLAGLPFSAVAPDLRSSPGQWASHWGPPLAALALAGACWLVPRLAEARRRAGLVGARRLAIAVWLAIALVWLALEFPRLDPVAARFYPGWIAAASLLGAAAMLLGGRRARVGEGSAPTAGALARGFVAAALLLTAFAELLHVDDVFSGRYERINTVFKLYYGAWPLLGVGAIALLTQSTTIGRRLLGAGVARGSLSRGGTAQVAAGAGLLLCTLLVIAVFYPLAAIVGRTAAGRAEVAAGTARRSLDGWAFAERLEPDKRADYAAIRALARRFPGPPLRVLEAHGDTYTYGSRFATNLGWVGYVGWDQHVRSWSAHDLWPALSGRIDDVRHFYTASDDGGMTPEERRAFLAERRIDAVVLGAFEREQYGAAALADVLVSLSEWTVLPFDSTMVLLRPTEETRTDTD